MVTPPPAASRSSAGRSSADIDAVIFQGGCRRGAPDDDNMSARRLAMVEGASIRLLHNPQAKAEVDSRARSG